MNRPRIDTRLFLAVVALTTTALVAAGAPRAAAQTIGALPTPGLSTPTAVAAGWTADRVEVPAEIAFGTMAVKVWARLHHAVTTHPVAAATLVLKRADGDVRIPMEPLDGAFDTGVEEAVATVDTYMWVRSEEHPWELWGASDTGKAHLLEKGSIRVKPRVAAEDLVLVDEYGLATPWIGSGGGGFVPGGPVDCGVPLAGSTMHDVNGDRRPDLLLPGRDGAVYVVKSARSGQLEVLRTIGCGVGVAAAAFGDLDGDGGIDLVTASSPRRLEIRRDLDDLPTQSEELSLEVEHLALADLDGDGRQEIYVALLGFAEEKIGIWAPSSSADKAWTRSGTLSPPQGGRGRLRALVPLRGRTGPSRALLVLSTENGQGTLESWGGAADIESVVGSAAADVMHVDGEPLGAVSGRFSDPASPSWLVWIRKSDHVEWLEVSPFADPQVRGRTEEEPATAVALDLDGDGDDDLATGGEDLRLWINVRGADFREAGESPYLLEARVVALAAGRLDE